MGVIRTPTSVKLFIGMISGRKDVFDSTKEKLIEIFGPTDSESDPIPFTHTDYYEKEMGKNLVRRFLSFGRLIQPDTLPNIKVLTNKLEESFTRAGSRLINLDPGYLSLDKLVLASTKNYSHRIYLKSGIYAEVTLIYRRSGGFRPLPWTYPDYRSAEYLQFFHRVRKIYTLQLKKLKK
jgi:hypothetical protein